MLWGGICKIGCLPLYVYKGKVNGESYIECLKSTLLPNTKKMFVDNIW